MILSITDFNKLLKTKLPNDSYLLKGEVRQPKISGGHMYLNLKDDNSSIKCIIWKSKLINQQKDELIDGDNIEVKGNIDFYCNRGEINFIISSYKSINKNEDKFNKLKNEFAEKGYFNKKNIKLLPEFIKNILIITSKNGAAIHDFIYTINNNKSLLNYTIIDVQVQGSECPKQIIEYLNNNEINYIDLVVITRGGGSAEDLNGFNNKELIETVYKRNYVLLSAIGHMVDTTLLDYASDISCPTPSLAAQYIIDHNKKYTNNLNEIKDSIKQDLLNNIKDTILSFSDILNKHKNQLKQNILDKINNYKYELNNLIKNNIFKLEKMKIIPEQNISIYESNNSQTNIKYNEFKKLVSLDKPFTIVWNDIIINVINYNNINE